MNKEKRVIVINPDRISRQIFPPFEFLVKALLKRGCEVVCLSTKMIAVDENCHSPLTLGPKDKPNKLKFLFKSLYAVFSETFFNSGSSLVVFRCADAVWHKLSALLSRTPIVFFVDYLPWADLESKMFKWPWLVLHPRLSSRILGFYLSDRVIFSSHYLEKEICKNLPFIRKKSKVIRYSPNMFLENTETSSSILDQYFPKVDKPFLIVSNAGYQSGNAMEVCLRALVALEDQNTVLALHSDHSDLNYFYSLIIGLGLSDRVEILDSKNDFGQLIAQADVLILPTSSAGSGGFALSALANKVSVLGAASGDLSEWLSEEELLFESGNVGQLTTLIRRLKQKDPILLEAEKRAMEHSLNFSKDWDELAMAQIV